MFVLQWPTQIWRDSYEIVDFLFMQYRILSMCVLMRSKNLRPLVLQRVGGFFYCFFSGCFRPLLQGAYARRSLRLRTKAAARAAVGRAMTHTSTPVSPVAGVGVGVGVVPPSVLVSPPSATEALTFTPNTKE